MLEACSVSYKRGSRTLIQQISQVFLPGKLYALIGPNGSGKSTLLKNLAGLWKPTEGSIFYNGAPLFNLPRKEIAQMVTLVSSRTPIQFDYPVSEVVAMGRYPYGESACNIHSAIHRSLETVDALHLKDRCITELSHGETQRVFLARALITDTPILLLDEPTTNLDIRHQILVWNLLKDLTLKGKTLIIANHDLAGSKNYCDKAVVLNQGEIFAAGEFSQVVTNALLESVFGVSGKVPDHYNGCFVR